MKHGKKYLEAAKAVDRSIQYDPADAISTVKKLATAKFDETIGKASFTEEQLSDNFQTLIGAINKAKPATLKGQYLKSVTLAPTMGPGVKVNTLKLA